MNSYKKQQQQLLAMNQTQVQLDYSQGSEKENVENSTIFQRTKVDVKAHHSHRQPNSNLNGVKNNDPRENNSKAAAGANPISGLNISNPKFLTKSRTNNGG